MNRPRRAAAAKPQGHYAATTSPAKRRKASDSASASARKKGKQKAQPQPLLDGIGLPMPGPVPAVPIPVITPAPLDPAALALDLNKSYEGKITPPVRPKRQPRWQQPAANPIIRIENTPNGWNDKEPDLDPDDLVAQIARCRERISDNIMTRTFHHRLRDLLQKQQSRDAMMALEPAGLSWAVVLRLQTLQGSLAWLQSENDKYELVANVTNIMAAYRSGQLRWNPGLVTYWSRGAQLCHPRPFRWDEFKIINAQYAGHTGFWVEGLQGPGPGDQMAEWIATPMPGYGQFAAYMTIAVQLPDSTIVPSGAFNPVQPSLPSFLDFMDDTGSCTMQINKSDMDDLIVDNRDPLGNDPPLPPLLGCMPILVANGSVSNLICRQFEVNMYDSVAVDFLSVLWHPVQVLIYDDTNVQAHTRLNGPWPRHRMYSASAPDGSSYSYFGDVHTRFLNVPTVGPVQMTSALPDNALDPVPAAGGKAAAGAGPAAGAGAGAVAGGGGAGGKAAP
ncbi:unnamed protein product [Penicillium crustosum]